MSNKTHRTKPTAAQKAAEQKAGQAHFRTMLIVVAAVIVIGTVILVALFVT